MEANGRIMEYLPMIQFVVPLLAIAGAWGGAKVSINGLHKRVDKLEGGQSKLLVSCAKMETNIERLLEKD